jgi:hypothetical protein
LRPGIAETIAPRVIRLRNPFAGNLEEARNVPLKANGKEAKILDELTHWL